MSLRLKDSLRLQCKSFSQSVAESLPLSTGLIVMKDYFEPLTPDIADSYSHE